MRTAPRGRATSMSDGLPLVGLARAQALLAQARAQTGSARLALLREAADTYRATAERHARSGYALFWAAAMDGLGITLRELSEVAAGEERVRLAAEAASCIRRAAEVYANLGDRDNWATALNNLGAALT